MSGYALMQLPIALNILSTFEQIPRRLHQLPIERMRRQIELELTRMRIARRAALSDA